MTKFSSPNRPRARRHPLYPRRSQSHLAGFLVPLILILQAMAVLGGFLPSFDPLISLNARIFSSLAPHLLILCAGLSVILGVNQYRRAMYLCLTLSLLGLVVLAIDYRRHLALPGRHTDLQVLWFNMLYENPVPPTALVAALQDSGADLIVLSEARPIQDQRAALAESYPYQAGCEDAPSCNLLIVSKYPLESAKIIDLASGPERMARMTITVPGKEPVAFVALHMLKPWYLGLAETDDDVIRWQLWAEKSRPLVVLGDFNAAPWSYRLRQMRREQNLRYPRKPVATWPAALGPFGVPIDHVLTRNGPGITELAPWGADLGSNHRGLLARIDLAEAP